MDKQRKINKVLAIAGAASLLFASSPRGQEVQCDGLCGNQAVTVSCACTGGDCPSYAITTYYHNSCGGTGFLYCYQRSQNIGSTAPCTTSTSTAAYLMYQKQYLNCLQDTGDPCFGNCASCYLNPCNWTKCTEGTSSPAYDKVAYAGGGTCP